MKHVKIKKLYILITTISIFLSFIILFSYPNSIKGPIGSNIPSKVVVFMADDKRFSFLYPSNWIASSLSGGNHGDDEIIAIVTASGYSMANVNIARHRFQNESISNIFEWGELRAKKNHEFSLISRSLINQIESIEYTWTSPVLFSDLQVLSHCQDYYLQNKLDGYVVSYCAKEKNWLYLKSFFAEIQKSFSFQEGNK